MTASTGGGTPASNTGSTNTSGSSSGTGASSSTNATITAPGNATFGGNNPNVASGATPNFTPASAPPAGSVLTFAQSALAVTSTTVADANAGGGTLTIQSQSPANQASVVLIGELKIPALSIDVPVFSAGLNGGTSGGQPNGGGVLNADFGSLNYTLLARWDYTPSGANAAYFGYSLGGYQTPAGAVPKSGTAAYSGSASSVGAPTTNASGGAFGELFIPTTGGGITIIRVSGNVAANVNFGTGAVAGSLSGMQFQGGATPSPWNSVNLAGTLSGAAISGTTSTSAAPANSGNAGFSSTATGTFTGGLYGPNGQEIGAIWTLYDPGGKSAIGSFAGK